MDTPIASGGAKSLDLTNIKDQATVRTAMKRWPNRWRGLTDAFKDSLVDDLVIAKTKAVEMMHASDDPAITMKAIDAINSTARTAVMMEGQVQADDHRQADEDRADSGKAPVGGVTFIIEPAKPPALP